MRVDIYFPHLIPLDTDLFLCVFLSSVKKKKGTNPKEGEGNEETFPYLGNEADLHSFPVQSITHFPLPYTPDRDLCSLWRILENRAGRKSKSQYISVARPPITFFMAMHSMEAWWFSYDSFGWGFGLT